LTKSKDNFAHNEITIEETSEKDKFDLVWHHSQHRGMDMTRNISQETIRQRSNAPTSGALLCYFAQPGVLIL
jgi:hypothetical protein